MPRRAAKTNKSEKVGGKRYPLNLKTTFETRQALERAARSSGRSLAQEIEYLVERSQTEERILVDVFGGQNIFALCQCLVIAMNDAARASGIKSGEDWTEHPEIFDIIEAAANREIKFRLTLHAGLKGIEKQ